MTNWKIIKKIIEEKDRELKGDTWVSQKNSMLEIIQAAEDYDIKPPDVDDFNLTQYRDIIKEAKEAIYEGNRDRLEKLINMANTLTVRELRIRLEKKYRPIILYKQEGGKYVVKLTEKQFKRVVKSTEPFFEYQDIKNRKEQNDGW